MCSLKRQLVALASLWDRYVGKYEGIVRYLEEHDDKEMMRKKIIIARKIVRLQRLIDEILEKL